MKIVHIITRLEFGGTWEVLLPLLEGARHAGHDVSLILAPTPSTQVQLQSFCDHHGIHFIWQEELTRQVSPMRDFKAWRALVRSIKALRPDVVHTHTSKAGFLGRLAAKWAGVPRVVHSTHGHVFSGYFGPVTTAFYMGLERLAAGWCDRIIVLSRHEIEDHLKRGIGSRDQLVAIPNGIDLHRFSDVKSDPLPLRRAMGMGEGDVLCAVIGRLVPVKGHEVFLKAFKIVREKAAHAHAVIIGDGELKERLRQMSVELGLGNAVSWLGHRDDIPQLLRAVDIVVQPSLNEGFGLAVVEAQAAGRPVVATRVGGLPEAVKEGETALLVPPNDPEALARAMLELMKDPARRETMGRQGQEWVRERFTIERMINDTLRLYESV